MSNKLLSDIFDKDVDVNGDGDITHIEFETWILQDYQKRKSITIHPDDQGQQMDTFTRLHLSAPKYTAELQKNSSPRQRRTSLNNPESGGDFRACLRGGHNSEAAKAWRQNYPKGTFNEDQGNVLEHDNIDDCTICSEGKYGTMEGANVANSCVVCPKGTYLDDEGISASAHSDIESCK